MDNLKLHNIFIAENSTPESFKKMMQNTVGDSSASYPDIEKSTSPDKMDMWLNRWAFDFVQDFTKNYISNSAPSGSFGYCENDRISVYTGEQKRDFGGPNSFMEQLKNFGNNKQNDKGEKTIYLCKYPFEKGSSKWDQKFNFNGEKIGWWKLLSLDWGPNAYANNGSNLINTWNRATQGIYSQGGQFCNIVGRGGGNIGEKKCNVIKGRELNYKEMLHTFLTTMEVATAFVPIIGPFLSAGFGLTNAAIYYKDGNNKDAAMSLFFSVLPGIGAIGGKIVGTIGKKGVEKLGEKLISKGVKDLTEVGGEEFILKYGKSFTKDELNVLKLISDNKNSLKNEVDDLVNLYSKDKKLFNKKLLQIKNSSLSSAAETTTNLAGTGVGLSAIPIFRKLNPTIKEKLEKNGWDFNKLKDRFKSDGSKKDNLLMVSALESGWDPETDTKVPEKFQTKLYKEFMETSSELKFDFSEYNKDDLKTLKSFLEEPDN